MTTKHDTIYAVICEEEGEGIVTLNGMPLVCMGEDTKKLLERAMKEVLPRKGSIKMVKFKRVEE